MWCGDTVAEHMTLTARTLGGYCRRLTPARSAAPYAHQLHIKAKIFGSNRSFFTVAPIFIKLSVSNFKKVSFYFIFNQLIMAFLI
jgi:hypothetical protein